MFESCAALLYVVTLLFVMHFRVLRKRLVYSSQNSEMSYNCSYHTSSAVRIGFVTCSQPLRNLFAKHLYEKLYERNTKAPVGPVLVPRLNRVMSGLWLLVSEALIDGGILLGRMF